MSNVMIWRFFTQCFLLVNKILITLLHNNSLRQVFFYSSFFLSDNGKRSGNVMSRTGVPVDSTLRFFLSWQLSLLMLMHLINNQQNPGQSCNTYVKLGELRHELCERENEQCTTSFSFFFYYKKRKRKIIIHTQRPQDKQEETFSIFFIIIFILNFKLFVSIMIRSASVFFKLHV